MIREQAAEGKKMEESEEDEVNIRETDARRIFT